MVTVDLHELNLKPDDVVLDAGCGVGQTPASSGKDAGTENIRYR